MKPVYINGKSVISPQKTFEGGASFFEDVVEYEGDFMPCIQPKYKEYISPRLLRRMSKIVRMGLATALVSQKNAGNPKIDAIITGTAWGCVQDTEKFLDAIVETNEEHLTPTAFIQSTHNTVAGQVALLAKNTCYNMTYVHRGASFESALLDGILQIQEGAKNVLVGGIDELTENLQTLLIRLTCVETKKHGEGAGFFVLSDEKTANTKAELLGVTFWNQPKKEDLEQKIQRFLAQYDLGIDAIDFVFCDDEVVDIFGGGKARNMKVMCGEYPTNSTFFLWLASKILNEQTHTADSKLNYALIYNIQQGISHSLILVKRC